MSIRYQDVETDTALDALIQADRISLFWEAFEKLGADCQKVMRMHFEETDMTGIANAMGYASENYARQSKFRCQKHLIEIIQADQRFNELKT